MDVPAYLARIGYDGPVRADAETLEAVQLAHLCTIPFENLDIGLKRPIHLDLPSLWDKIILHRRGGFCYELNGLFAWLLEEIGFSVTCLNARHYYEAKGRFGIEFDHLALLATAPGDPTRWLADVGYGETFTRPLDVDDRGEQVQGGFTYWLEPFREGLQLWQRNPAGEVERQYHFDLSPHLFPSEYEAGCTYHQTSPLSSFTQKRLISRLTPQGRITLGGDEWITTADGVQTRTRLTSEEECHRLLLEQFGFRI